MLAIFGVHDEAKNFTMAFCTTMLDLMGVIGFVFLLVLYLIRFSIGLKLVLAGIDSTGVACSC